MSGQAWIDLGLLLFLAGMLICGLRTGTIPAPPMLSYHRDAQPIRFWAVVAFYLALILTIVGFKTLGA